MFSTITRGRLVPCHVQQEILLPNAMYTFSLSVLLMFVYSIKTRFVRACMLWAVLSVTISRQWFLFGEDSTSVRVFWSKWDVIRIFISSFLSATMFFANSKDFDAHCFFFCVLLCCMKMESACRQSIRENECCFIFSLHRVRRVKRYP